MPLCYMFNECTKFHSSSSERVNGFGNFNNESAHTERGANGGVIARGFVSPFFSNASAAMSSDSAATSVNHLARASSILLASDPQTNHLDRSIKV